MACSANSIGGVELAGIAAVRTDGLGDRHMAFGGSAACGSTRLAVLVSEHESRSPARSEIGENRPFRGLKREMPIGHATSKGPRR